MDLFRLSMLIVTEGGRRKAKACASLLVMPAKAGIHLVSVGQPRVAQWGLDSCFRRNDREDSKIPPSRLPPLAYRVPLFR